MAGVGVSMSGGGHRASLFGLGVLLYLVDAGKNEQVTSISSVSGGSLTNAFVGQALDLQATTPEEFDRAVAPFATRIARRGTFLGRGLTGRYPLVLLLTLFATAALWFLDGSRWFRFGLHLALVAVWALVVLSPMFGTLLGKLFGLAMAVTLVAGLVAPWVANPPGWFGTPFGRFVLFVVALMLWVSLVFARRGAVCAHAYRRTLFTRDGRADRLASVQRGVDHVLCATELQSAEPVYFSSSFVYGYRFGLGDPSDLRLSVAAQASANLPFAFPARWLRTAPFRFRYPKDAVPPAERGPGWRDCPPPEDRPEHKRFMVLSDGGVYDNMADQWPQGFASRAGCWPDLGREHHEPDELIVANASAGLEWEPFKRSAIPAIGGLLSLLKVKDVLYDQTTAQRRAGLVGRFDRAALAAREGHPQGMRGALVHIPQHALHVPRAFRGSRLWPERAGRAERILPLLEPDAEAWIALAGRSTAVGTVLSALGDATAVDLLKHGYVLAMVNLHVILNYPWLGLPPDERFTRLLAG